VKKKIFLNIVARSLVRKSTRKDKKTERQVFCPVQYSPNTTAWSPMLRSWTWRGISYM